MEAGSRAEDAAARGPDPSLTWTRGPRPARGPPHQAPATRPLSSGPGGCGFGKMLIHVSSWRWESEGYRGSCVSGGVFIAAETNRHQLACHTQGRVSHSPGATHPRPRSRQSGVLLEL